MNLPAGRLRHRISLFTGTETQDPDTGILTPAGEPFAAGIPAAIEPLSTREFLSAAATQAQVSVRIIIRYRDGVLPTMTVEDERGKRYNVLGPPLPDPESGVEYLTLMCAEVSS